jgi:hypothetical protein
MERIARNDRTLSRAVCRDFPVEKPDRIPESAECGRNVAGRPSRGGSAEWLIPPGAD